MMNVFLSSLTCDVAVKRRREYKPQQKEIVLHFPTDRTSKILVSFHVKTMKAMVLLTCKSCSISAMCCAPSCNLQAQVCYIMATIGSHVLDFRFSLPLFSLLAGRKKYEIKTEVSRAHLMFLYIERYIYSVSHQT